MITLASSIRVGIAPAGPRVYPRAMGLRLVIALLSLLLVGMQQQLFVHELVHFNERLDRGSDVVAQNPAEASCIECSLLSGGLKVISVDEVVGLTRAHADRAIDVTADPSRAKTAPTFYLSRAPPAFV